MDILAPQFKATEESLLAGLHWQMSEYGCAITSAGFRAYRGSYAEALFTEQALALDVEEVLTALQGTGPNNVNEEQRTVSGVANVLSISRTGIRLSIEGIDLTHYNQHNPVVLAQHQRISAGLMPGAIGTVERAYKAREQTELRFRNMRFDTDPIAEAWYQKVLVATIRMVSVGFGVIEAGVASEIIGSGKNKREILFLDVPRSELWEISPVCIGANLGALIGQTTYERLAQVESAVARLLSALGVSEESDEATMAAAIARLEKATAVFHDN